MKRGSSHSEEAKAKNAAAHRGRSHSPETRARMSATRRGKPRPPEIRVKMVATQFKKGHPYRFREGHLVNLTHGLSYHPLFKTWSGMMHRCYNPEHSRYKYYGEKGITVLESWHDPAVFLSEITALLGS